MKALDFEYDNIFLSDLGFMLCKFDSGGVDTVSNGSEITFNTVSTLRGTKHELTSIEYGDCLTSTFQICSNLCDGRGEEISLEDSRDVMRWLNRKGFHKFRLLDDEYSGIYFEASFNVSKIEIDGRLYGFELEMFTNRPFAIAEPVTVKFDAEAGEVLKVYSKSDDEGYVYPNMEITVIESGNLTITNYMENRKMIINNCVAGEVITIEYPMISSSLGDGRDTKIQNDFNWVFFRLASTFKNKLNEIEVSLPCEIKLTYSPIVKVGI